MGYIRNPISAYPGTIPQLYGKPGNGSRRAAWQNAATWHADVSVPIEGLNWENPNFRLYIACKRSSYGTRSPLHDHTRIIDFILKVPDGALNS